MKKLIFILIGITFLACEKEQEPTFTTVRKVKPIEGNYKGNVTLRCDSLGIKKTYNKIICIASTSSEEVSVDNHLFSGIATLSQLMDSYTYSSMYWKDYTDCDVVHPVFFEFKGSGKVEGDSLNENGWFIAYKYGKKYTGKWSTKAVRFDSQ